MVIFSDKMSSSSDSKFWCGDCEKGYKRKIDWEKHFTFKVVKGGEKGGGQVSGQSLLSA